MRKFEPREVTRRLMVETEYKCDGCGIDAKDTEFGTLVEVSIAVNHLEEGGSLDTYDYCDDCLMERKDILIAAGSKAELITGVEKEDDDHNDDLDRML